MHSMAAEHTESGHWHWIRVYHADPCKDRLLLEGIEPALETITPGSGRPAFYFERSSVGGPNIVIGLFLDAPDLRARAAGAIEQIREYLRTNPSRPRSRVRAVRMARALATYEARFDDPGDGLVPDGTVVDGCDPPPGAMLGPGPLLEMIRWSKVQSSRLALDWLKLIRAGACGRSELAVCCLIGVAWVASPERLRAHLSFHSHVNGFFRDVDRAQDLRDAFERHYQGQRGQAVRTLLRRFLKEPGAEMVPHFQDYLSFVRHAMLDLEAGLVSGTFHAPGPREYGSRVSAALLGPVAADAAAAWVEERFGKTARILESRPSLRAWQITVNVVYVLLNQLGISPMERFFACYCLTHAIEEVFGESAEDVYGMLVDPQRSASVFSLLSVGRGGISRLDAPVTT
jgi:hypothetical protein